MRTFAPRVLPFLLLASALPLPAAAADSAVAPMGGCASFLKQLDEKGKKSGIARPDLYDGMVGWLAMKARVKPDMVLASARRAPPDVRACSGFGVSPEPLLALEAIVANLPAARVVPSVESCLAALKVIEDAASTPGREAAKAASAGQARILVKLLGYLAKDKRPAAGAVDSQAEALKKEAAGDLRSNAVFGSALSACGPLGVDVALLARIRASL